MNPEVSTSAPPSGSEVKPTRCDADVAVGMKKALLDQDGIARLVFTSGFPMNSLFAAVVTALCAGVSAGMGKRHI